MSDRSSLYLENDPKRDVSPQKKKPFDESFLFCLSRPNKSLVLLVYELYKSWLSKVYHRSMFMSLFSEPFVQLVQKVVFFFPFFSNIFIPPPTPPPNRKKKKKKKKMQYFFATSHMGSCCGGRTQHFQFQASPLGGKTTLS